MPAKHLPYPYVEPVPANVTALEIESIAERYANKWGFRDNKSMDEVCKNAGVDIEYSHDPNEIMLEVPLDEQPVAWLPRKGRKRDDRVTLATALGHWILHVKDTQKAHPGCGIQALYAAETEEAATEAMTFALAFLMPKGAFVDAWYDGRSQEASDRFDVPTKIAYLRAETLELGQIA